VKFHIKQDPALSLPHPVFEDEPDAVRRDLLYGLMYDFMGSEDLYLAALDRAEAGTPELNWCNHFTDAEMYPDGRVVIQKVFYLLDDAEKDNPPQTVITIAEARKLILDWLEAEKQWYAEREAREQTKA
jgi:hypothetical protein